jgi:hypothetical protein
LVARIVRSAPGFRGVGAVSGRCATNTNSRPGRSGASRTSSTRYPFRFEDGTRLGDLVRQGQGVLLEFRGDHALRRAAKNWEDRIQYAAGPGVQ